MILRSCWLALAMVCALAASGWAEDARPDDLTKFTQKSATDDGKAVVEFRPLVRNIAPQEPLRAVLHLSHEKGPFTPYAKPEFNFDFIKTLAGTQFLVGTPDGESHMLTADFSGEQPFIQNPVPAYAVATPFLRLNKEGVTVTTSYGDFTGKWKKELPDLKHAGEYTLRLQGELAGDGAKFDTGEVKFKVGMGLQPIEKLREEAVKVVEKQWPDEKLPEQVQAGAGFVPNLVYEDADGNYVFHFHRNMSKERWSYDLIRVKLDHAGDLVQIAQCQIHTCVAEGTPIATPSGPRAIETLRVGDEVTGYNVENNAPSVAKIRAIRIAEAPLTLVFESGLRVTPEHPIHTPAGWITAGELTDKSQLLGESGERFAAGKIKPIDAVVRVYDLTVDEPHTYFAGGILVHNKRRLWNPKTDAPWGFYWGDTGREWKVVK